MLFSCVNCEPMVMDLLPFDKYELERSPLTQYILENVKPIHCWQVSFLCIVYLEFMKFIGSEELVGQA